MSARLGLGSLAAALAISIWGAAPAAAFVSAEEMGQIDNCAATWSAADRNGDGWLDQDEIDAAGRLLPDSIRSPASVSQRQFMEACVRQLQGRAVE